GVERSLSPAFVSVGVSASTAHTAAEGPVAPSWIEAHYDSLLVAYLDLQTQVATLHKEKNDVELKCNELQGMVLHRDGNIKLVLREQVFALERGSSECYVPMCLTPKSRANTGPTPLTDAVKGRLVGASSSTVIRGSRLRDEQAARVYATVDTTAVTIETKDFPVVGDTFGQPPDIGGLDDHVMVDELSPEGQYVGSSGNQRVIVGASLSCNDLAFKRHN
nr:hypothetical protein [Tanacetum cinerariifolium]